MTPGKRRLVWLPGLVLAGLMGCQPATTPSAAPASAPAGSPTATVAAEEFDADSGPFAAGKKVFVANNCFKCHAINGVRGRVAGVPGGPGPGGPPPGPGGPPPGGGGFGPGGGRAPDLGKVGGDEEHSVAWLMDFIRNPKAKKANAKMPPFEGKIKDDDLRAMAEYLASLK